MRLPRALRPLALVAAIATVLALTPVASAASAPPTATTGAGSGFAWLEATVADTQAALASGELTCEELVAGYLARIDAYDQQGPTLRSMISVNPAALDEAAALDAEPSGGALDCVPVVVKDNVDVLGLPTTAGSAALADLNPPDDAFITQRLRDEGAIILGKANLDEFAFGFGGASELGGQAGNAYDPAYGPGGSSSGSGTAIGASLGVLAIGTDTGGSIRVPSSVNGLVGIRPSMRLLSQDGIVPLALFQDTAGPMCRTVEDCAVMLEVMAGYDGSPSSGQYTLPLQRDDTGVLIDSAAAFDDVVGVGADAYTQALDADGLDGARIGVVRALFGDDEDVLTAMDAAIDAMEAAGAIVEDVVVEDLSAILGDYQSMSGFEFYHHLGGYLAALPDEAGDFPRTYEELAEQVRPELRNTFNTRAANGANRFEDETYIRNTIERPEFVRPRLQAALDNEDLEGTSLGEAYDTLLYPAVLSPPREGTSPVGGSANRLSPFSGFPALTMPAGFTEATDERVALPIGMEMLGREFDEPTLLRLAYGFETVVEGTPLARQAPTTAPELERETPPVEPPAPICDGAQGGATFPDAPGSGHREFIDCLAELGIVEGLSDGTFAPRADVSRGQLASFVVRAIELTTGQTMTTSGAAFPDVGAGSTHGQAIHKLRDAGIIRGYEDGTFRPRESVTRDQTARYVVNAIEHVTGDELPRSGVSFPDAVGSQYASDIDALATAGIASGFADGTFGPRVSVTRGQMSRIVGGSLDLLAPDGLPGSG